MFRRLARRATALLARTRFENDMRAELASHIEHRTDDLISTGLTREEAARQARLEFGALEAYKEKCRDSRGFSVARITLGFGGDLKLAARRLRATPFFLLFAVLSLAVGVTVTTSAYALIEATLWKPLGIARPESAAVLSRPTATGRTRASVSLTDFEQIRRDAGRLGIVAASAVVSEALITPAGAETLRAEAVTGDYFRVLGLDASLGRTIQASDERASAAVIVLSHRLWRTRFGADPMVVGRSVRFGGHPFDVIGVAPRRFDGIVPNAGVAAWVPLSAPSSVPPAGAGGGPSRLSILVRLAPGETMERAAASFASVGQRLDTAFPIRQKSGPTGALVAVPRQWSAQSIEQPLGGTLNIAGILLAIVAMVLLVACTNLANLMLARGTMRQHEFAVRRALGASRWRLIREQCAESALIALMGGAVALGATRWVFALVPGELPGLGFRFVIEPVLSVPVLLVAAGAVLLSMLTFGLEPAIQLTRKPVTANLASEAGTGSVGRARRQRALIRWQVAICTCFFLIVSILGRVVIEEARHDSGIDIGRLAVARINGDRGWDDARGRRAIADVIAAARQEPGIDAVAVSIGVPFGGNVAYAVITTMDKPFVEGRVYAWDQAPGAYFIPATPGILRTLGIPLLAGRGFDDRDDVAAAPVVILSEHTARELFGTRDVVGRQMMFRDGRQPSTTATIIGVVPDSDAGQVFSRSSGIIYAPLAQHFRSSLGLTLSARTAGDPAAVLRGLQAAVQRADMTTAQYGTASLLLTGPYVALQVAAYVAAAFGAITLLLSMVGLYGVQSQAVAQRTREVGVRAALGATALQIERMVLADGFRPVVQGLALGLMLGSLARLTLRAVMDAPIDLVDPVALIVVPIPLAIAAFLACRVPASRAARVSPNAALRQL